MAMKLSPYAIDTDRGWVNRTMSLAAFEQFTRLCRMGWNAQHIADKMQLTRDEVIAIAHRNGVPLRP